jgi:hypothetical protein
MECWVDVLRGMAIIAIAIHHRLLLMPCEHSKIATIIRTTGNRSYTSFLSSPGVVLAYHTSKRGLCPEGNKSSFTLNKQSYPFIIDDHNPLIGGNFIAETKTRENLLCLKLLMQEHCQELS